MHLIEKKFLDRSTRDGEPPYGATMSSNGEYIAYLKANGNAETLVLKATEGVCDVVLASDTFILSPCFAGDTLCWSENRGADWILRSTRIAAGGEEINELSLPGRPMSLSSSSSDEGAWLVWEQRNGKKTQLYLASVTDGTINAARKVDTDQWNAYDPVCAINNSNQLHIAYCAFRNGNYRIIIQPMNSDGSIDVDKAIRVSNESGLCVYPSLCRRSEGGVWFSFTSFDVHGDITWAFPYIKHFRRAAQLSFFRSRGIAMVGLLENGKVAAPLAPPSSQVRQGNIAAMRVFGSEGTARSRVFEDQQNRLRLLLRQHNDEDAFQQLLGGPDLQKPEIKPSPKSTYRYADLCLMSLEDQAWSNPTCIIPRAHFDNPIPFSQSGNRLRTCFTQDSRVSGHRTDGEWFDTLGELAVGIADVELSSMGQPQYVIKQFILLFTDGPSMEEPILNNEERLDVLISAVGQLHCHTSISVCNRERERDQHFNYRFIQDVQHADFAALTDHEYNMWPVEETFMKKLAEYYYFPGSFVSFPGYEWTGSYCTHEGGPFGHVNVLWFGDDARSFCLHNPADPDDSGNTLEKLWGCHEGEPVLTIPHHVVDALHWYNWSFWSEDVFTPVVEIFQDCRGSGEIPDGPGVANFRHSDDAKWIVDELKKGKRFGFVGGGDHYGVALAGCLVTELTRTGIWEALQNRRCFATTGVNATIRFTCNGREMGEFVQCEKANFEIRARAEEIIKELQIVRNGKEIAVVPVDGKCVEHVWTELRKNPSEYWHCRLLFENGEIIWTSPIWLDH